MRWGIVALGIGVAAVVAVGAYYYQSNQVPPRPHTVQVTAAPADNTSMFRRDVRRFDDSYRAHRHQFVRVSDYSERARRNWMVGLIGFAVFVLLTLPRNGRGVRAFYRQMMERAPLSDAGDVTDDDNRQARKVLFFYLLFLLYQIVQYPLTFGRDNLIQFSSDLAIQAGLLIAVVWSFHGLKRGLRLRWKGDPAGREKMEHWLGARLAGMNIRWRDVRRLALGVFIVGFAPAALARLTGWLDALTDFGRRFTGN